MAWIVDPSDTRQCSAQYCCKDRNCIKIGLTTRDVMWRNMYGCLTFKYQTSLLFRFPQLYILTSTWVLCKPNTGWNMLFDVFCMKNVKKEEKWGNIMKTHVLGACTQTLVDGFVPRKKTPSVFAYENMFSLGKNLSPALGCKPPKMFFASFCLTVLAFSHFT